ncbi:MAG: hypothetical protein IJW73_02705 [Candidatus Gastranaerophilales bacterium]|nr:hypothetical protein [Candidatus Gastranaerophilales bacterium]
MITLIDVTGHTRENHDIILSATTLGIRSQLQYLKEENLLLNNVNGNIEKVCVVGKFSKTPTQYTGLNPKQTFRAVDWFDFSNVQGQLDMLNQNALVDSDKANIVNWLTPDYTAIIANVGGNLGSAYTAPCAGYYIATIGKNDGSAYLKINGAQAYYYTDGGGVSGKVILPFVALVGKGDVCEWGASVDISYTSFVPLKGAN